MNWSAILYKEFAENFGVVVASAFVLVIIITVWVTKVNTDRNDFKNFMGEVKEQLQTINDRLWDISGDITLLKADVSILKTQQKITQTNSPISLTELGQKVSEEIDAREFAKEEAKRLIDQIPSKSPYTVQEFAFDYIKKLEPQDELLLKLENSAFNNGITLPMVKEALAVELRDALLKMINEQSGPSP